MRVGPLPTSRERVGPHDPRASPRLQCSSSRQGPRAMPCTLCRSDERGPRVPRCWTLAALAWVVAGLASTTFGQRRSLRESDNTEHGSVRVDPLALVSANAAAPRWMPTFGGLPGTDKRVSALTVFDDGGGPELYAGGAFTVAGGVPASRVAAWDGARWAALASGMDGDVLALAVFDD